MPGDSVRYQTNATTNIQLLSITDANGCPVFSNIGDPLLLRVTPADSLSPVPPILACTSGSGDATFDLRSRDSLIAGGIPSRQVRWFRDSLLQNPIANPAQFTSSGARVFAQVVDGTCTAGPLGVDLIAAQSPTVELPLGGKLCEGEPCLPMGFSLTGKAPFLLAYALGVGGNTSIPGQITFDSSQAVWNICPAQFGLAKGDLVFTYHTLTDANGCSTPMNNQRSVVRAGATGINEIKPVLCAGDLSGSRKNLRRLQPEGHHPVAKCYPIGLRQPDHRIPDLQRTRFSGTHRRHPHLPRRTPEPHLEPERRRPLPDRLYGWRCE
ncbi:MAG: hypothetical protein IPK21_05835 [Haliscomenobacter sp.]|nr:hypothetical protein [Haliscomenobacter sp.]